MKKEDFGFTQDCSFVSEVKWKGQRVKEYVYIIAYKFCGKQHFKTALKIPTAGTALIRMHYVAKIEGFCRCN